MPILRLAFFMMLVLLGGCGLLIGIVTGVSALSSGSLQMSYAVDGRTVLETATRAGQPERFWRLLGLLAALPAILGAAACWYGVWRLRR